MSPAGGRQYATRPPELTRYKVRYIERRKLWIFPLTSTCTTEPNLMHRLGSQERGAILRRRAGYVRTGGTDGLAMVRSRADGASRTPTSQSHGADLGSAIVLAADGPLRILTGRLQTALNTNTWGLSRS